MFALCARVQNGLTQLKVLLEEHIHQQGLDAVEKCQETAMTVMIFGDSLYCVVCHRFVCVLGS